MKAATRAAKLRQKRGRPKHEVEYREPNGRASRSDEPADKLALETRARRLGLTVIQAKDQRAETYIGYLAIMGPRDGLSEAQYEAAIQYLRLRADWLMSKKAPNASVDNGAIGTPSDYVSDAYIKWCEDVDDRYTDCRRAIQEAQGEHRSDNLYAALDLCIIQGQRFDHMIGATRLVCNALVKFFRC
ncbi:hypothetical protein EN828_10385 [Mesorhizobium sp. M2D.F.Ca.ET.185.01.1.1]|uniref:hypothetical protein n=1 Tax=unclassified Mesorhizobium TaxID=325217 RepID=UPI000FD803F6|nr:MULTISPECIES: hypothetical protein [unclassified Mesorhizobium]TGQ89444.1 hypothetical protein EN849_09885 [Mesorhizobium sp. M2D.F.Ca.ET.206.01.1.1]TGS32609.1 hypothetical protein EN828_10385 [Mesorhizobium sp. M2D.F.Ca.ET.185.01.1.1]TGU23699.1 hypothetical protein EN796_009935 [Mesorhizobium sp. M2D.F.Ca.ET.153.01.1.1]